MRFPTGSLVLLLCLLVVTVAPARAEETAPFGLSWGESIEKLKATGVRLSPRPQDESGIRFAASNLPKALPGLSEVVLSFGTDDHLQKVEAVSDDYRYDSDGKRLKARYAVLSQALTAKYGKGEEHHSTPPPWNRPEDFLMGILQGSSQYYTTFAARNVTVRLEIRAARRDVGSYALIFRYRESPSRNELLRDKDVL